MGYVINFLSLETEMSEFIKMLYLFLQNNAEVFVSGMCIYVCAASHRKRNAFGCCLCERSGGMHGALPGNS